VLLLREEMRRTPISLRHKAAWWGDRRSPLGFEEERAEGAAAYATRQATLYNSLASSFETLWAPVRYLEVVDEADPVRAALAVESDHDPDEADEEDGNDGMDGEEGGEEEQPIGEDEEGSTGELSQGEEDEDAEQ
jgi:hypothetical protein